MLREGLIVVNDLLAALDELGDGWQLVIEHLSRPALRAIGNIEWYSAICGPYQAPTRSG